MIKYTYILLLLFIVGCGVNYSGYSHYTPYTGISFYFKRARGSSNLINGYPDPPFLDPNNIFDKDNFAEKARDYLDGVINDLKEVKDNADNAAEKIDAVVDAVNLGFEYFNVRHVGSVLTLSYNSNFEIFDYPEFPDFDYFSLPPRKPIKPLFLDNQFIVDSYNREVEIYNEKVANFIATAKDYIEDAKHYIKNCRNDHEEIRQKGLHLLNYIESINENKELNFQTFKQITPNGLSEDL